MEIKIKSIMFFVLLVLLISIVNISAFGVGCAYTNENPLKLFPGESSDVLISLQNNEEISLKASILVGSDIAILDASDVYNVPANGSIDVKLNVNVPASASIGQEYVITVNFLQVSEIQGGTVGFNTAMEKSFKVLVVEKPAEETPAATEEGISLIWWILGIVVVIAIIVVIRFVIKNKEN